MNRKKNTWFGITLTQKQSVSIFILSIAGLIISVFLLWMVVYPFIMNFMYFDPYYYPENYIIMMILSMLPYVIVFCGVFLLSLYSLIRCRKIAKYYSPLIDPVIDAKPIPRDPEVRANSNAQFCSNCGEMKKAQEKFCTNCGHQA